jgi:UDP-N-acetylmuramyl pentapeptide synthase
VHYRIGDMLALARTPLGRAQLGYAAYRRSWPFLRRAAALHRLSLSRKARIVAVVGSFGKTTTARAVATALGKKPHHRVERNAFSYVAEAVFRIRPSDRHAVVEVGIGNRGQMAAYARVLRPNVTVVTSIGSEHNRSLGTLDVTRTEKAEMVRSLTPSGLAVLNGDDPHVRSMKGQTHAQIRTFGFDESNDVWATDVGLDWPRGTRFTLFAAGQTHQLRVRLLGRPGVYATLAAVAVALAEGFSLDQIIPRLEALEPTPGRLELMRLPNGAYLLRDDYKSTLETIDVALDVLEEVPAERRIVVLGEVSEPPGSQGPIYRRLGQRVAQLADRAVFVGGNFQRYAAGAARGGLSREALIDAGTSVQTAVEAVRQELSPGDVVLVKGRDTQRLDRISLALAGQRVRCDIKFCDVKITRCSSCPMLERGWNGRPLSF